MDIDDSYMVALANRAAQSPVDVMRDGSEMIHVAQADDFTQMATEMAAGTEPEGATPMSLRQFAETAADVPAGLVKGAVQGTAGFAGDMISIGRAIGAAANPLAGESRMDAFLRVLGDPVTAFGYDITSEGIADLLDQTLGPVVPEGSDPRRVEAAKTAEFVGEVGAMGKMATDITKGAVKGMRNIGKAAKGSKAKEPK